ncbi:glycosyltransferase family 1 protein [Pollutibacter soli]|uniref:glycosyltransferase family 4 protein n=1 Tax=Pollutibacter soli TaxID=3034157 RepID=UPI0030140914
MSEKPTVCWIGRKRSDTFFSIEKVFSSIKPFLKGINILEKQALSKSADPKSIFNNGRYFSKQRADLYHITGDVHYAAMFLPGDKTVLTIHDCVFLYHPDRFKRILLRWLWLKLPAKRVKYITTISEKSKEEILKFSGCSPDKIIVIPDPVDAAFVPRSVRPAHVKPRILQIGVKSNKNLERVAEALKGINCTLHIIGKLNDKQTDLLNKNQVDFTNRFNISEEELIETYHQSDLLLFASLYEGFGLPIIEAQASGIPVITSSLEPMRSNAGNGALIVDPENIESIRHGVQQLINDKSLREKLVEEGFRNVQRFRPEVIAESYQQIYKKILESIGE